MVQCLAVQRLLLKLLKVTGRVAVANVQGFLSMKDDIFGLLLDDEPFLYHQNVS